MEIHISLDPKQIYKKYIGVRKNLSEVCRLEKKELEKKEYIEKLENILFHMHIITKINVDENRNIFNHLQGKDSIFKIVNLSTNYKINLNRSSFVNMPVVVEEFIYNIRYIFNRKNYHNFKEMVVSNGNETNNEIFESFKSFLKSIYDDLIVSYFESIINEKIAKNICIENDTLIYLNNNKKQPLMEKVFEININDEFTDVSIDKEAFEYFMENREAFENFMENKEAYEYFMENKEAFENFMENKDITEPKKILTLECTSDKNKNLANVESALLEKKENIADVLRKHLDENEVLNENSHPIKLATTYLIDLYLIDLYENNPKNLNVLEKAELFKLKKHLDLINNFIDDKTEYNKHDNGCIKLREYFEQFRDELYNKYNIQRIKHTKSKPFKDGYIVKDIIENKSNNGRGNVNSWEWIIAEDATTYTIDNNLKIGAVKLFEPPIFADYKNIKEHLKTMCICLLNYNIESDREAIKQQIIMTAESKEISENFFKFIEILDSEKSQYEKFVKDFKKRLYKIKLKICFFGTETKKISEEQYNGILKQYGITESDIDETLYPVEKINMDEKYLFHRKGIQLIDIKHDESKVLRRVAITRVIYNSWSDWLKEDYKVDARLLCLMLKLAENNIGDLAKENTFDKWVNKTSEEDLNKLNDNINAIENSVKSAENLKNFEKKEIDDLCALLKKMKVWLGNWRKNVEPIDQNFINNFIKNNMDNVQKLEEFLEFNIEWEESVTHNEGKDYLTIKDIIPQGRAKKINKNEFEVIEPSKATIKAYKRPSEFTEGIKLINKFIHEIDLTTNENFENIKKSVLNLLIPIPNYISVIHEADNININEIIDWAKNKKDVMFKIFSLDISIIFKDFIFQLENITANEELEKIKKCENYSIEEWGKYKEKLKNKGIQAINIEKPVIENGTVVKKGAKTQNNWERSQYKGNVKCNPSDYGTVAEIVFSGVEVDGQLLVRPNVKYFTEENKFQIN